jgi:hypothetical protein
MQDDTRRAGVYALLQQAVADEVTNRLATSRGIAFDSAATGMLSQFVEGEVQAVLQADDPNAVDEAERAIRMLVREAGEQRVISPFEEGTSFIGVDDLLSACRKLCPNKFLMCCPP